ncbi:MAG: FIG00470756: hypothetical protein [uncultured Sulfurovum sp.]|uniref:Uncharacterized protein n=1 Tax=uncultured Sulfurovum sp. TaxID=269237 RepID=A0A6S6UHM4_9BACT|nr:MAG: FIG00470756: hypothetical protein [uncultured Sulfurovum sp.]
MFSKKSPSENVTSSVKKVITLDPYIDKHYVFKNDKFQLQNKLNYNTSHYTASYLQNKNCINTSVFISRSIPEEDISDVLEIKAYEELGLDQTLDYSISSVEIHSDEEEREFSIFVTQADKMDALYVPIKEHTKYIDLIIPAPLLYKALYNKEVLALEGVHAFVYFTHEDSFVTLYKNGEFLYAKSIPFSYMEIYDKYCEATGNKVEEKEFFTLLETDGLKTSHQGNQEKFMQIFAEVFMSINDIIIYAKRAFRLENIDKLYIGSQKGDITGINEYAKSYLGLDAEKLDFNYNIKTTESYVDQLQYLMLLTAYDYIDDEKSIANLTMFPRAPAFQNRASGQFIIAVFAAISIGLAYPIFYLLGAYMNDAKILMLSKENNKLQTQTNKYKQVLGVKKKEIEALDVKITALEKKYDGKTKTLTSIYDKKVNYRLKSSTFHDIAEELTKHDVKIDRINSKDDTIWVSLVSSSDRKLTELIKYISDTHFSEINNIDIEMIHKDNNSSYYKGLLKVELK